MRWDGSDHRRVGRRRGYGGEKNHRQRGSGEGLTGRAEDAWVALVVAVGKLLQYPVDMLGFLGQLDPHEQLPDGHVDRVLEEGEGTQVAAQDGVGEGVVRPGQDAGNGAAVDSLLQARQILGRRLVGLAFRHDDGFSQQAERVWL